MRRTIGQSTAWLRNHPWPVAGLLAAVFFAQALGASQQLSLTWDEPSFISAGYVEWKWGAFDVNSSHPPLMQLVESAPVLHLDFHAPAKDDPSWRRAKNPVVELGKQLIFRGGQDPIRVARLARLPVICVGTILILLIFAWGRQLWGPGAGLLAAALAAFDPNLLAHSELATEDIGCTTLVLASCWMLYQALLTSRRWRDWIGCGVLTGLALIAKYSALILLPVFALIALWVLLRAPERAKELRWLLPRAAALAATALLVIGAGYKGTFNYAAYLSGLHTIYADMLPDPYFYLLGQVSPHPFWFHNLIALLCKTPVGTLLLLAVALASLCKSPRQHAEATVFLLVPVLLIIGVSCFDHFNLGLRRILPAFPFLLLFAARAWVDLGDLRWLGVVLAGSTAAAALSIYPEHLSFFNTLAGGAENGPYITDDSNLDWGQDLPALARWEREHPEAKPLRLDYFGTAAPEAYGVSAEAFDPRDAERPRAGTYAMSATRLTYMRRVAAVYHVDTDWLGKYTPIDRAGYSILIYRFDASPNP